MLKEIIKYRERAIRRDDVYEIQRLTKHLKKQAKRIRAEEITNSFKEELWDPIKI